MIGVSKKLFDRFRAEKLLDHEVVRDGRRSDGRRVNCLTFHVPSSIAGLYHQPMAEDRGLAALLSGARGTEKSLKQLLSLIHISEPTRQAEISYAVFCL